MSNPESPSGLRLALLLALLLPSLAVSAAALLDGRDSVPAGYASPPYYPTPYGGWDDQWSDAYQKAVALVSRMTVAEKVNITAGTGLYMVRRKLKYFDFFLKITSLSLSLLFPPIFLERRLLTTFAKGM